MIRLWTKKSRVGVDGRVVAERPVGRTLYRGRGPTRKRTQVSASPSVTVTQIQNKVVTTREPRAMMRAMTDSQVETVWRTASEQCELVWNQFSGVTLRLWVRNRLILEEATSDMDTAFRRAWELRIEWPRFVD